MLEEEEKKKQSIYLDFQAFIIFFPVCNPNSQEIILKIVGPRKGPWGFIQIQAQGLALISEWTPALGLLYVGLYGILNQEIKVRNIFFSFFQVFFYLNRIFESAGIPAEQQNYASIAVGCVNVALTVVAVSYS